MRLELGVVIACQDEQLVQPDFTSDKWKSFAEEAWDLMGVDVRRLTSTPDEARWQRFEIDDEQQLYRIIVDARCIRDMWTQSYDEFVDSDNPQPYWISDIGPTTYDWQAHGRGESAYWLIGLDFTIGITQVDVETALAYDEPTRSNPKI